MFLGHAAVLPVQKAGLDLLHHQPAKINIPARGKNICLSVIQSYGTLF